MPKRLFFRALIAALSLLYLPASAQIELKLSNLPNEELQPGTTRTIVLNVKNTQNDTLDLKLVKTIPRPLRALIFTTKIKIPPKSTKNVLIPISIPRATSSGEYTLSFGLNQNGVEIVSREAKLQIAKIIDLTIDLIQKPAYARTIDTISARFMIMNNGTATESVKLRSANGLIKGINVIQIHPDSNSFVDITITNDPQSYEVEDQLIDLFGRIAGIKQSVGDQEVIKVYPTKTRKVDPFFRFPVVANFNYFTQNTNGEYHNGLFQFQITGKGPLDVDKKHRVDFSYRGPGAIRITRLGNFSQKYVHYSGPKLNVTIGEKTYGLSDLTENFRFGTGIEMGAKPNENISFGGYYNRPIFQPDIREQFGGFVSYTIRKKYTYRINSLNNFLRNGQTINLTSVRTDFTNFDNWRFATEFSRSFSMGKDGIAAMFNTNLISGKLTMSSNGLYADKHFKGYYNNSLFGGLNMAYNFEKIGFTANANYNNSSPNLDTVYSVAPISFFSSFGIVLKPFKSLNIQAHGLYREKTDRLASKNFDYSEERIRVTMNFKRGTISSRLLTEAGNTYSNLSNTLQKSFGYDAQMQVSYRPKQYIGITVFSQFLSNTRFTNATTQYLLYGADIFYRYKKRINMSVEFQNNYLIEDLYNDRNLFNLKMGYNITRWQSLNIIANYGILHQSPIRREWYLSANYLLKLGVPMIRITELGSLEGKLLNGGVESVDNIVLMMDGQLVTTDKEGFFSFNNVRPGIHQLFIDRATIGVRDLPDVTLPIEVEIFPEQTQTTSITMTKSARVTGKIDLDKSVRSIQSKKQEAKFPSIIVEATNGEESLLTRADDNGNFVFGSLRPGNWKIRMVPTYWKDDFVVKKPYVHLDLAAGQEEHITMILTPKVRRIRFLNQKTLKVGGK